MRAIWSGSLSFGLINIPVKVYSASVEKSLKFRMLAKDDLCPIGYARICKYDNREVNYDDIVKGYEYQKGDYVVLQDEDFQKANMRKTKTIDIVSFAQEKEIGTIYFDRPYYIEPDPRAEKAYVLLREALKKTKKVGVAKFVFRERERIGILKVQKDVIMLDQLRYQDEIKEVRELKIPQKAQYSDREIEMAISLIDQLAESFEIAKFHDTYTEELEKVIEEKSRGRTPKARGREPEYTKTADLLQALKKSLERQRVSAKPKK